jgi:cephalosporin hydroxylase
MLRYFFRSKKPIKSFSDPVKNLNCKELEVNNWIVSDFVISNLVPVVGFHPYPLNELMLMTSALCRFKPELLFEWGTNIGKSARIFYEIKKAFELNFEIHSIDLPDNIDHIEHPKNERGILVRDIAEVLLHQGDGVQLSLEIIQKKSPKGNILFFVDGDHEFETVQRELDTILTAVPNAVVLLHDTFYQSEESAYNVGPNLAIKNVLGRYGDKYRVISTQMGLPGMSLVYRNF